MTNELIIVNAQSLSPQTISEIDRQVDNFIERHKINRCELNRLVFDSTAALTAAEKAAQDMTLQGKLKRFWKRFTGSNARKQDDINANFIQAQYAAQQTLQKLAEQNLLSFELIAAVNNKLNVQMAEVNVELNDICSMLLTFFSDTKQQLEDHDKRLKKLEHSDKLQHWTINIENQTFDGIKYRELDDATKIVCVVRDFLKLTNDGRSVTDFDYLETAMGTLGFKSNFKVSGEKFIRQVSGSSKLYNYLFGNDLQLAEFATEYEPIILELREAKESADRKFFVVKESKTSSEKSVKEFGLNIAFSPAENFLLSRIRDRFFEQTDESSEIGSYDLALELLYNLEQAKYAKEFHDKQETARKLFIDCKIEEALPLLKELEAAGDVQSRYILALIYNEGINGEKNPDYTKELLAENISAGDSCSVCFGVRLGLVEEDIEKIPLDEFIKLADEGDVFIQYELAKYYSTKNPKVASKYLESSWKQNYFIAGYEFAMKFYSAEDYEQTIMYFECAAAINPNVPMLHEKIYLDSIYKLALKFYSAKDYEKAKQYFERVAEKEHGPATLKLGDIYFYGHGSGVSDKSKAVELYKKAYELGESSDNSINQIALDFSRDGKGDNAAALKWWQIGAEKNYPLCLANLGWSYRYGKGVVKNWSQALKYFESAIAACLNNGYPEKQLGDLFYEGGNGINQDYEKAATYYETAVAKGRELSAKDKNNLANAEYNTGFKYRYGLYFTDKDYRKAVEWYKKADSHGKDCVWEIANCYEQLEEYSEALKWYRLGEGTGDKYSAWSVGDYYQYGKSVSKNYEKALAYYKRAIELGNDSGLPECGMAEIFFEGDDHIKADRSKAIALYWKAANKGCETAQQWLLKHGKAGIMDRIRWVF